MPVERGLEVGGGCDRLQHEHPHHPWTMWQQVNNVERCWSEIRKEDGLDWVTPHAFRQSAENRW